MMIKQAMELADARGMMIVASPTSPTLGRIRCRDCGWPNTPDGIFDVLLERYVSEPHGCHPCEWAKTHGQRPRVSFNGHPAPDLLLGQSTGLYPSE